MGYFFDLNNAETGQPKTPTFAEAQDRFLSALQQAGLDTSRVHFGPTGGEIMRCDTQTDKRGGKSGWYVVHETHGVLHGCAGNWQTGEQVTFTGREIGTHEVDLVRAMLVKKELDRLARIEMQRLNGIEAAKTMAGLQPCSPDHPYLVRKGIQPHGALQMGADLVIPMTDGTGQVISGQKIWPQKINRRDKEFWSGCTTRGWRVLGASTEKVAICEGWATGASLHEATGMRVYVAFSASGIEELAEDIASIEAVNGAQIVIAADNDETGMRHAERAAEKLGGAQILAPALAGEDWNDVAVRSVAEVQAAFAAIRPIFQSWDIIDFAAIPRREWLYGNVYIRKFCSITVAPGGLGKSTLVLIEAVALATGRNLLGVQPVDRQRVVYFNAEDPKDEIKLRVAAICIHFKIDQAELSGWLFIQSGRDREIMLATGDPGEIIEGAFQQIEAFLHFHRVDVLIMDPLANIHDSEEDNRTYRKLGKRLSLMAEVHRIAIMLVHHTKKLNGMNATVEDSRGGSALIGAVRVARAINPMEPEEAARFGLDTHIDHFRIDGAGKNNLARPSDKAEWYVRIGVAVPNGDWCAVAERWVPPDPFDGISTEDTKRVQIALQDATEPWRESAQSPDWVGVLIADILGLDVEDRAVKARIKSVVKTWLDNGVIAQDSFRDKSKGRDVPIIVIGKNLM